MKTITYCSKDPTHEVGESELTCPVCNEHLLDYQMRNEIEDVFELAAQRYLEGRQEYEAAGNKEFSIKTAGEIVEEVKQECLDGMNYFAKLYGLIDDVFRKFTTGFNKIVDNFFAYMEPSTQPLPDEGLKKVCLACYKEAMEGQDPDIQMRPLNARPRKLVAGTGCEVHGGTKSSKLKAILDWLK